MASLFDNVPEQSAPAAPAPTPIRPGVNVSVDPDGKGGYWARRLRADGASSHATHWSGPELDELIVQALAARRQK